MLIIRLSHLVHDLCHLNPCNSGGTCSMSQDHYRCDCPDGLTGAVCENGKIRIHSSGNVVCYHVMLKGPCCTIFYLFETLKRVLASIAFPK